MASLSIIVYSHNFVVTDFNRDAKRAIISFVSTFAEYDISRTWSGEVVRKAVRMYSTSTANRTEYRLHRNALDEFLSHMSNNGFPQQTINLHYAPPPVIESIELDILPQATPRENQYPLIEHLLKPIPSKLAVLQMGGGKTFSFLYACGIMKQRMVIVIKPMYIKRWVKALLDPKEMILDLKKGDVLTVQGTAELRQLIQYAKEDRLKSKFIIISNRTLYAMYEHYERTDGDTSFYGVHPVDFYPLLKANRGIDEVHQEFHFNFIQDMYTHTQTTLSLSATMTSDIPFINRMYRYMFPLDGWYEDKNYNKYIAVKALYYSLKNEKDVKYLRRGRASYSHNDFEQSIIKSKTMLANYLEMVCLALDELYFYEWEQGQKAIIFAARIEMCQIIVDHLRKLRSDLVINKYTSGDPYENLLVSDISVSTIGSSGTAVDIPDLKLNLSTTAINKSETNLQVMGRLRQSKRWPDMTPIFAYFVCENIPKHISYHNKKIKLLKPFIIGHQTLYMDIKV